MKDVTFYAFLPLLKNKVGHIHAYNLAVHEAVRLNGWKYKALIPKSCELEDLPYNYEKLFLSSNWEKNRALFHKIVKPLFAIPRLCKFLKSLEPQKSILFLESFFPGHFFALAASLLFVRKKFTIAIVHRYSPKDPKYAYAYKLYNLFQNLLKKKTRLILFTDTSGLAKEQKTCFNQKVHLLPIPHHIAGDQHFENLDLILWWPGGSVRIDKGLNTICRLSTLLEKRKGLKLYLAENAKTYLPSVNENICFLPKNLSENEYEKWMHKANLILLPYLPTLYCERSSGIFVEAICAGAIPVTTKQTWMADELKKFNLEELLINWNSLTLVDDLVAISQNKAIKEKLAIMRQHYQHMHSIQNFGFVLSSSLKENNEETRKYLVRQLGIPLLLKCIDFCLSFIPIKKNQLCLSPKKILLCNGAHLGDLINATAAIPVIKKAYPQAKIGFVVGSWSKIILKNHPDISWLHEFDHWKINRQGSKIKRYLLTGYRTFKELKKIRYDVCIDLYAFFGNMAPLIFLSRIPIRIGFTSGGFSPLLTHAVKWNSDAQSIVYSYRDLLLQLDETSKYLDYLRPSLSLVSSKKIRSDRYVILHPGSGASYKEWPIEKWQNLAHQLRKQNLNVVVTGSGEKEREIGNLIVDDENNYANRLNWEEFRSLVANALYVIGVDSVVGHLAAAQNVPTFTIIPGIHPHEEWLPFGPLSHAIKFDVPCTPCRLRRGCATMNCVRNTDPNMVLEKIKAYQEKSRENKCEMQSQEVH